MVTWAKVSLSSSLHWTQNFSKAMKQRIGIYRTYIWLTHCRVILRQNKDQFKMFKKDQRVQHFLTRLPREKYSSYYKLLLKHKKWTQTQKQAKVIQDSPHPQIISKTNQFYHISRNRFTMLLVVQSKISNKSVMWQKATAKTWSATFQIKKVEFQFLVILWWLLVLQTLDEQ